MRTKILLGVLTALIVSTGGAANAVLPRTAGAGPTAISASDPCGVAGYTAAPQVWDSVVLIVFENKPLKKIIGNTADAPYLNSLAGACSYSTNMTSLSTTSLANYVALTSGYTGCGAASADGTTCTSPKPITSNSAPSVWPQPTKSIFELMDTKTTGNAVEWAESMPSNCSDTGPSDFVINHSPFQYYTRTRPNSPNPLCPMSNKPFTANPVDQLSASFNLIIPNKPHIMHLVPNSTISQRIANGDNWAKSYIPALLNSAQYQAGRTAILITWDEGNSNQYLVPFIVITPYTARGGKSTVAYDHYSTLKGIQEMVNATPLLGHAADPGKNSVRDDPIFHLK